MWKFFSEKKWFVWSWIVTFFILGSSWIQVKIDVRINEWFGDFYNMIQKALSKPNSITSGEFYGYLVSFAWLAAIYVGVALVTNFIISHWLFRWRQSMVEYYHANIHKGCKIEGSSQRIQEDTIKFARIMETLGVGLVESIMMLIAFLPILISLSAHIKQLPIVGNVSYSLIWVALFTSVGGTILLAVVGIKLPGIEYDIQKEEAAYRKNLVFIEESNGKTDISKLEDLFANVRKINFKSYYHYAYFNIARYGYGQAMVLIPYAALAPTIITGALTLGVLQQTIRAFGKVHESMQYVVKSWPTIIELISVRKRLKEFEKSIESD
jgi:peptide/bleomycin uptake transporter